MSLAEIIKARRQASEAGDALQSPQSPPDPKPNTTSVGGGVSSIISQRRQASEQSVTSNPVESAPENANDFDPMILPPAELIASLAASAKEGNIAPIEMFFERFMKTTKGDAVSLTRGAENLAEGVQQKFFDFGSFLGAVDPETAEIFTQLTKEERAQFQKEFKSEFGDSLKFKTNEMAGEILPWFLVPGAGQSSGVRTLLGTLSGAAGAGSVFIDEGTVDERVAKTIKDASVGGMFGFGLSAVMEMANKARLIVGRIAGSLDDARNSGAIDRNIKLSERTGVDLKLSQVTDDAAAQAAERSVGLSISGANKIMEVERRQAAQSLNFFKKILVDLKKMGAGSFGVKAQQAFDKTLDTLTGVRKRNGSVNFKAAQKAAIGSDGIGDPRIIPTNNFLKTLDEEIAKISGRGTREFAALRRRLQSLRDDFSDGLMSPEEMQRQLSFFGDAANGRGSRFQLLDSASDRRISSQLNNALKKDLDFAADAAENIPGGVELRFARDQYKIDSAPISELKEVGLQAVFDGKVPKDPDAIMSAFLKMDTNRMSGVVNLLSKQDPTLLVSLQHAWLTKALSGARRVRSGDKIDAFPINPDDILKLKDNRELFATVFSKSKEIRKRVLDGIAVLSKISKSSTSNESMNRFLTSLAGVAASRDPTFVARLGAEIFTPRTLSKILMAEDGLQIIRQMGTPLNQNQASAILGRLQEIMRD